MAARFRRTMARLQGEEQSQIRRECSDLYYLTGQTPVDFCRSGNDYRAFGAREEEDRERREKREGLVLAGSQAWGGLLQVYSFAMLGYRKEAPSLARQLPVFTRV